MSLRRVPRNVNPAELDHIRDFLVSRRLDMYGVLASVNLSVLILLFSCIATAEVPPDVRTNIDRIVGGKGAYSADDGAYKVVLPREAATIVQDFQKLSLNLELNSWVTFSSAVHHEAILAGQFLLLEDEVNPVLTNALDAGLEVSALAPSSLFDGPQLHMLHVSGRGKYEDLAGAFRKGLDEIRRVRRSSALGRTKWTRLSVPTENAIDGRPLDAVLSMRGTVADGVYKAAIGKRAVLNGELVGREMGIATWLSVSGMNGRAVAQGEFVETAENLQNVLKALRAKGINIESIRNHTVGEHPQFIFVRFWGQGVALELAKAIRYVLEVDAGALSAPGARI
jgi:hypothetical protein